MTGRHATSVQTTAAVELERMQTEGERAGLRPFTVTEQPGQDPLVTIFDQAAAEQYERFGLWRFLTNPEPSALGLLMYARAITPSDVLIVVRWAVM